MRSEEFLLAFRRDLSDLALRVRCAPGQRNRPGTQVRAEDLYRDGLAKLCRRLHDTHGDRVDFFSSGASRRPDAKREIGPAVCQKPRQELAFQSLKGPCIAKETGHRDEEIVGQRPWLGGIGFEEIRVL